MAPTPDKHSRPSVTIGELEANYPLYCKALRMLLIEGRSGEELRRTLCWQRLTLLHRSLPGRYKEPEHLMLLFRQSVGTGSAG
ncbi:MAG: DUF3136 domain-containing protein [Cyanobacteriota bacterium]